MFYSGLTKNMFQNFLKESQLERTHSKSSPFVYVDSEYSEIRLLTNILNGSKKGSDIFAVSIACEGDIEFLSTEE